MMPSKFKNYQEPIDISKIMVNKMLLFYEETIASCHLFCYVNCGMKNKTIYQEYEQNEGICMKMGKNEGQLQATFY